ncbi:MAG: YihY/virulence factor BrkB family protein [Halobacteriaceae archaeon]
MSNRRRVLGQVLAQSRKEDVTLLAAAVAYYAFVSVVPLLLLAVAVGSVLGGEPLARSVVRDVSGFLTPTGQDVVVDALTTVEGRVPASLVSVVLLLWSGLKAFRALDRSFSRVYGVRTVDSLLAQLSDAVLVLGTLSLAAVSVVVLGAAVPSLAWVPYSTVLGQAALLVALPGAFLPVYVLVPDVDVSVREGVPGAVFAGLTWTGLTVGFQVYATTAGMSVYGMLGAVLLLITELYLAAIVIMVGAVLNAVLAGRVDGDDDQDTTVEAPEGAPDITEVARDVAALRTRLEEKTVDRAALETDLRGYVRRRIRANHARGWGPYLVLLYGTVMTVAAFSWLSGGWAILAMLVVWLSTLGLYVVMLVVGVGTNALGLPGRILDWVRSRRR